MAYNIKHVFDRLEDKTYLDDTFDNELLKLFLEAKRHGEYYALNYGIDSSGCSDKTILKSAILIKQGLKNINKPFSKLTRDDIIDLKNKFNKNEIKAKKYKLMKGVSTQYETEMKFSTKKSIMGALSQFWQFYQEYSINTNKEDIANIFDRIKLKRVKQTECEVDWLSKDQIKSLVKGIKEPLYKLFVCLSIDQAPRPIELVNIRYNHFTIEDDKLYCRLPEIKGCSGRKHKTEVLFEKDFIRSYIEENASDNDLLFDFVDTNKPFQDSKNCFDWNDVKYHKLRLKIKYLTNKLCKYKGTPYIFRRSSTMYWLDMSNNDLIWVQQRLGHVEGSDAIRSYMNLQGISTPDCIKGNMTKTKYVDVEDEMKQYAEENTSLKLQMAQMQEQFKQMQEQQLKTAQDMQKFNYQKEMVETLINATKN